MELYIRVKNGQTVGHPIVGDNFHQVFPAIDTNNLPSEFARFTRVEAPIPGVYEVYEGVQYQLQDDGSCKDVHSMRDMTANEKTDKQDKVKVLWEQDGGPESWVFNEETCSFDPPTPRPDDGKNYQWDENTTSWVEIS